METLTIFDKDYNTAEEGRLRGLLEVKFLQPSMGVRYDYSRARVPKRNNFFFGGGGGSWLCTSLYIEENDKDKDELVTSSCSSSKNSTIRHLLQLKI